MARGIVRKVVYLPVCLEEIQIGSLWVQVQGPKQPIKVVVEDFVDPEDARLKERVLDDDRNFYENEAERMRLKSLGRRSPCRECREKSCDNGSKLGVKRMRTKGTVTNGKRVIASVRGVETLSTGYIDCVTAEMLIDAGAVACQVHLRVLKRSGRASETMREYYQSLNAVSGHLQKIGIIIDLPLHLSSHERMNSFVVIDQLPVDAILGTDALKNFKAVVDLDESTLSQKGTGGVFPIGAPRLTLRASYI
ncbi:hypothetical protein PC129_g16809 [Phytophthora cactorum]|uniref:Uncharacterized protein n=1 Tax=Phytophthora cactorum TaxID=29920 RepID=A0A8T1G566_9STRA|nr:hypothetical protein PC111_g20940 [Phytophthora cactorum]KAG2815981.1 hypothetical protein PC112_g13643 [Phytophthora cactorum]KAG2828816.1 hypothetical protein PC113_g21389 [Phytophthora cactorum]KAG2878023.1 hypothetical protein PC114_g23333 [Phytophthora cactorum]KAG2900574.1 hypothetical protein PC115_g16152 [Phytophthora cactorum]